MSSYPENAYEIRYIWDSKTYRRFIYELDFINEYQDQFSNDDWASVVHHHHRDLEFIRRYKHRFNNSWEYLTRIYYGDIYFLTEFEEYIDWDEISWVYKKASNDNDIKKKFYHKLKIWAR